MDMSLNDFQRQASSTAIYPGQGEIAGLVYATLGMAGEAGEVANVVKKVLRDDNSLLSPAKRARVADELGDVLWYAASVADELGISFEEIASGVLAKLNARKDAGTIGGSGDKVRTQ